MVDTSAASVGGDNGLNEDKLSMHQPAGDVEMDDLSKSQHEPVDPSSKSPQSHDGEEKVVPAIDKDGNETAVAESSVSAQLDGPSLPENEELTIDPVESSSNNGVLAVNIMLQLTNGARHPFSIDEKYLTKHNVTVTGKTEDGSMDPASITIYTLKELILRDWRSEWEEPPREPSSIRLIHFGKLLEDRNQLSHYHFSTTTKNWLHMTVKPQDLLDEEEAAKKVKDSSSHHGRSGCCIIL